MPYDEESGLTRSELAGSLYREAKGEQEGISMFKSGYIAILGAPNSGKSTLLNAILKDKIAAVTDKPQTTRKRLKGIYTTDSCQMIFLDTPGIHYSEKKLNRFMMDEINQAIADADILCYLVSLDQPSFPKIKTLSKPSLLVINKSDLPEQARKTSREKLCRLFPDLPCVLISALQKTGIDNFLRMVEGLMNEGPRFYPEDELTDASLREISAEIIREKVFESMHQEIPYATAVEIIHFKESADRHRIEALIIVEQESQKGMVIGKGGAMIKKIGSSARVDLEKLVGTKVFLDLKVKVDKNWTKNQGKLDHYGYKLQG